MLRDKTVMKTLGEAAKLITARLPEGRQLKPLWQKTAQDLMAACQSGSKVDIGLATAQLRRALEAEGWL